VNNCLGGHDLVGAAIYANQRNNKVCGVDYELAVVDSDVQFCTRNTVLETSGMLSISEPRSSDAASKTRILF
jgi:hypothetical protein